MQYGFLVCGIKKPIYKIIIGLIELNFFPHSAIASIHNRYLHIG
jgi:hypothetical protein